VRLHQTGHGRLRKRRGRFDKLHYCKIQLAMGSQPALLSEKSLRLCRIFLHMFHILARRFLRAKKLTRLVQTRCYFDVISIRSKPLFTGSRMLGAWVNLLRSALISTLPAPLFGLFIWSTRANTLIANCFVRIL
jgi:hypothetical protein